MMNAVIDFGNTRGKWAVFEGEAMIGSGPLPTSVIEIEEILRSYSIQQIIVSKVGNDEQSLIASLKRLYPLYEMTHQTPLPIENTYGTPNTLGMDRLAGVVGAWALFPNQASLVIDAGTCVTYDFINRQGVYLGGAIAPGMRMRANAMNHFTAKLPMIKNFDIHTPLIGKTTQECLASGAIHGMLFELEGQIGAYRQAFEIFNTVLCGGDASFFETKLKAPIFAHKELVMVGLNKILTHLLNSPMSE